MAELLLSPPRPPSQAFIKWGQWAATRHDLFPPDLCSELELLHSQVEGRCKGGGEAVAGERKVRG